MAITRKKKEQVVSDLKKFFSDSSIVIFTDFKGMGVEKLSRLRTKVRENGGSYVVAKKSLINLALKEEKIEGVDVLNMEGEIAVAFSKEDPVSLTKAIYDFAEEEKRPSMISAVMDDEVLELDRLKRLALIPSREELLTKLVGSLNAPISGLVRTLNGNISGLVYALSAIADSKKDN